MNLDVDTELKFDVVPEITGDISVIIVAAGSSQRMNGQNKMFAGLLGIPVIARTLRAFQRCDRIGKIILVTREEDVLRMQQIAENYLITKLSDIVVGGKTRGESVKNGIDMLSEKDKYVLIHDGARPLVSEKIICDVCDAAVKYGAATCAVPLKDTVKILDNGFAVSTPDRKGLCAVQTPQGFSVKLYKDCLSIADGAEFTDDCAVIENAGKKVYITDGSYMNIKITTPEDIIFAEGILKSGGDLL